MSDRLKIDYLFNVYNFPPIFFHVFPSRLFILYRTTRMIKMENKMCLLVSLNNNFPQSFDVIIPNFRLFSHPTHFGRVRISIDVKSAFSHWWSSRWTLLSITTHAKNSVMCQISYQGITWQERSYWARNYYLLWVAWNKVINLHFVHPQKAAERNFFHPVSRNP